MMIGGSCLCFQPLKRRSGAHANSSPPFLLAAACNERLKNAKRRWWPFRFAAFAPAVECVVQKAGPTNKKYDGISPPRYLDWASLTFPAFLRPLTAIAALTADVFLRQVVVEIHFAVWEVCGS